MKDSSTQLTFQQALDTLGVGDTADAAVIRSAYLKAVAAHPPDTDPDAFEKIRDAYELLRDPMAMANRILEAPSIVNPLLGLLPANKKQRRFAGPGPWLAALKEKP